MPRQCHPLVIAAALLLAFTAHATFAAAPKKIVLIAGPITGHPKDAHEYEKSVILLKHLLDTSPNLSGIVTEAHFRGWPDNPQSLDDADTIVLITDGADRPESPHPLYMGDRLAVLERQMRRGCGLVNIHWTTFHPAAHHAKITEWIGGYFDYENGPGPLTPNERRPTWYSRISTWDAMTQITAPDHPIARGVRPFSTREEYYYHIRFREDDPRVTPIATTQPPNEQRAFTVGWAVQRDNGGRSFGFTGGHFYRNWWNADFRRMVLNAIVWSAAAEVPAGGVESNLGAPARALILTGYGHPAHDWRAVSAALIGVIEQDPRMVVDVTENIDDLAGTKINDYDLLVLNYANWDRPGLSQAAKVNFIAYLESGGNLAVIHGANGAFTGALLDDSDDWPEFRRIVRRVWGGRASRSGHDDYGPMRVTISDSSHAVTAGLSSFDTIDELYFRQAGNEPIHVLAEATSKMTNQVEPMAWVYEYGRGRVFQTVLGHSDESIRKAGALIRRGCVWAAGLDQISFDPPPGLTEGLLFRRGSQWSPAESAKRGGP